MKYNKGDILVCCNNKISSYEYNLTIGDKYEVVNSMLIHGGIENGSSISLDVVNVKTGEHHRWISDRLFISLDVYREFKLREILN